MNRATSPPLHLHVGKKTPVHLHISSAGKKRLSRLEQQQISSTELAAGRPSVRPSDSFLSNSSCHWVSPSSSAKIPWVPPPGKSSRGRMAWEGQTHRLEIHPDCSGMSVVVQSDQELSKSTRDYEKKVRALREEVEHLRAEVNHQNSLHAFEVKETETNLHMKEAELAHCQDELLKSELENVALKHSLSRSRSPSPNTRRSSSRHRVRYDLHMKEAELAHCEEELLKKELENVALKHSLSRSRSPSPRRPSTFHTTRYSPSPCKGEKSVQLCTKPTLFTSRSPSTRHSTSSLSHPVPQPATPHSFTTPSPHHIHPSSTTHKTHHSSITPSPHHQCYSITDHRRHPSCITRKSSTIPSPHHRRHTSPTSKTHRSPSPPHRRHTSPTSKTHRSPSPPHRRHTSPTSKTHRSPSPHHRRHASPTSKTHRSPSPPHRRHASPTSKTHHSPSPHHRRHTSPSHNRRHSLSPHHRRHTSPSHNTHHSPSLHHRCHTSTPHSSPSHHRRHTSPTRNTHRSSTTPSPHHRRHTSTASHPHQHHSTTPTHNSSTTTPIHNSSTTTIHHSSSTTPIHHSSSTTSMHHSTTTPIHHSFTTPSQNHTPLHSIPRPIKSQSTLPTYHTSITPPLCSPQTHHCSFTPYPTVIPLTPPPPHPSPSLSHRDEDARSRRREFLAQLATVEAQSRTVLKHANNLKVCIKKLQKDRRFVSIHAIHVSESKDVFLASLSKFEKSNKELKRLIEAQEIHEVSVDQMNEYQDLLEKKMAMIESTNQVLRGKLEEHEKASLLSKQLHGEIGQREGAIQSLNIRIETLEEELHQREERCSQLQNELTEVNSEKEVLKQLSRHQKDRVMQNEKTLQSVGSQLDEANAEFAILQNKLSKSNKELMSNKSVIASLQEKVHQLETLLTQTRVTAKVSMDAVSDQLAEKTRELTSVQMETDRLKSMLNALESRLHETDNSHHNKIYGLQQEVSQLNTSMSHCEGMASEYKLQLKQSREDHQELIKELQLKEKEIDQLKREAIINSEKERLKFQQQLAELEHMPELLKSSEQRLAETQGQLLNHEQRCGQQSRLLAELSVKAEQSTTMVEALKEKLKEASLELHAVEGRLVSAEDEKQEAEKQRRELMGISGRKEEMVQRLQGRVEELVRDTASLTAQLETAKADMQRQNEQVRERAASKDRANVTRITDLESQLNRANTLATQFRKSKDDMERRYHSRVHELQDRLDQANSTKRSLENYITFLKSSYASVFSDSHHVPGSPIAPPSFTH